MPRTGLNFSNIHDKGNGVPLAFGLMTAHAAISLWYAAWYSQVRTCGWVLCMYKKGDTMSLLGLAGLTSAVTPALTPSTMQVMGSDAGGDLTGPRKHPFFLLGFKLGPDDPRGWDWFTHQVREMGTQDSPLDLSASDLNVDPSSCFCAFCASSLCFSIFIFCSMFSFPSFTSSLCPFGEDNMQHFCYAIKKKLQNRQHSCKPEIGSPLSHSSGIPLQYLPGSDTNQRALMPTGHDDSEEGQEYRRLPGYTHPARPALVLQPQSHAGRWWGQIQHSRAGRR